MDWVVFGVVAVCFNVASSQSIGRPCTYPGYAPTLIPTIAPTAAPTVVDGNVVQSLIDTIQLFIVSGLLEETLPDKQKIVTPVVYDVGYEIEEDDCDVFPYEFVFDSDCPDFVTALVPRPPLPPKKKVCVNVGIRDQYIYDKDCPDFITAMVPGSTRSCVNFGLNEELVLPPLAPELPCGLGYLPGGLPVVAKAYAPCSKCCGCGCGSTPCSSAALPICSPYSCAALACPLSPDLSPYVKPIIL